MRLALLLVSICALAACAGGADRARVTVAGSATAQDARQGWLSPLDRDHPLVGRIWDVAGRRFVTEAQLEAELMRSSLIVAGEQHDNADAHALQARLLDALVRGGRSPALVAEMLDETMQPAILAVENERPEDPDALARAVEWQLSGWPEWSLYRPVFARALSARLQIVAAGVERKRTMTIAREGASALEPALLQKFALDQPLPPAVHAALRDEMRDTHCGMLPETMLDSMVFVQRVRDAVLASHLLAAADGSGAFLIAGNGHARSDRGVPALIAQRTGRRVLSVGLLEVSHDWREPAQYASSFAVPALPFDYVWFTPRASDADHCAELRSHAK